jgi:signal recognition particle receptor subunit beta
MVLFNYSTKELTAKVVYYGPGLCGKTTNLQWIHEKLPIRNKGKMLSLATEADRTLFFDFLPIELGSIRGMKTRIQLYTVPGQVFYNATRRMVLKGADCVVFVADSQEAMIDADLDSMANLRENLEVNEINPDEIPMVLQYNKRDLPNALPVETLNERLNPRGLPFFEAVAMKGIGVEETLKGATTLVFKSLAGKYGGGEPVRAAPPAPAPPAPAPLPPAAAPQAASAPARPAAPPPSTPSSRTRAARSRSRPRRAPTTCWTRSTSAVRARRRTS